MTLARTHLALVLAPLAFAATSRADERLFTYSYQATTIPAGQVELETWATFSHRTPAEPGARSFQFRHELEIGLTDRIQLDVYLADWSSTRAAHGEPTHTQYDDSAVVLKIAYLDPHTDGIGLASYHEVKVGDEFLEFENKLLLQKNWERWTFVYNLTLEAEWEGSHYEERSGEIANTFGAAYECSPAFFVGGELIHELPLPDWHGGEDAIVFAGPDASYRFGGANDWWVTATAVKQLTDEDDEPEWQFRMIVGLSF